MGPPGCALLLCRCASPWELCATHLMKSCVISVHNTLFSHRPCALGAAFICSLVFSSFCRSQRKYLSLAPVLGDFSHVMPLCPTWCGVAQLFPRPPAKTFFPLCKTIIISANWAGLGLNLQDCLGLVNPLPLQSR